MSASLPGQIGCAGKGCVADILAMLRRDDIEERKLEESFGAISVVLGRCVVHGEESQGLAIDNPHRYRIAFQQEPEGRLSPLALGDVDVNADASSVCRAALLDADPAAVGQALFQGALRHRLLCQT